MPTMPGAVCTAAAVYVQEKFEKQGMNEAKRIFFFKRGDETILPYEMTKKHK